MDAMTGGFPKAMATARSGDQFLGAGGGRIVIPQRQEGVGGGMGSVAEMPSKAEQAGCVPRLAIWPSSSSLANEMPMIDHKDGNPSNNRLSNLRATTYHGQAWNRRLRVDNTSGRQGVTWNKQVGKWQAGIMVKGARHHLGLFTSIEMASDAHDSVARKMFGAFYRKPQYR